MASNSASPRQTGSGWFFGLIAAAILTVAAGTMLLTQDDDADDSQLRSAQQAEGTTEPIVFEPTVADSPDAVGASDEMQTITGNLELVESTWAADPQGGSNLLVLYRNLADTGYDRVELTVEILGRDNEVLDTQTATVQRLVSSRIFAFNRRSNVGADDIRSMRIAATAGAEAPATDGFFLTVDNFAEAADGAVITRGQVTANFDPARDEVIVVAVLRDAEGNLMDTAYDVVPLDAEGNGTYRATAWPKQRAINADVYLAS